LTNPEERMMNNEPLFDEIARVLASPMPRRQALKHILGGFAGAALTTIIWPGRARADKKTCSTDADCATGSYCCNKKVCCTTGQLCCSTGENSLCCPEGGSCCGNGANTICCSPGQVCTGNGSHVVCMAASPS
jgi:hypothetical protein